MSLEYGNRASRLGSLVKCKCGSPLIRVASGYVLLKEDGDERRAVFHYSCIGCGRQYYRAFMQIDSVLMDEKSYLEWRDSEIAILIEDDNLKRMKEFLEKHKVEESQK